MEVTRRSLPLLARSCLPAAPHRQLQRWGRRSSGPSNPAAAGGRSLGPTRLYPTSRRENRDDSPRPRVSRDPPLCNAVHTAAPISPDPLLAKGTALSAGVSPAPARQGHCACTSPRIADPSPKCTNRGCCPHLCNPLLTLRLQPLPYFLLPLTARTPTTGVSLLPNSSPTNAHPTQTVALMPCHQTALSGCQCPSKYFFPWLFGRTAPAPSAALLATAPGPSWRVQPPRFPQLAMWGRGSASGLSMHPQPLLQSCGFRCHPCSSSVWISFQSS